MQLTTVVLSLILLVFLVLTRDFFGLIVLAFLTIVAAAIKVAFFRPDSRCDCDWCRPARKRRLLSIRKSGRERE